MRPSLNVDHELVHSTHAGRMHECSEYRVNVRNSKYMQAWIYLWMYRNGSLHVGLLYVPGNSAIIHGLCTLYHPHALCMHACPLICGQFMHTYTIGTLAGSFQRMRQSYREIIHESPRSSACHYLMEECGEGTRH